MADKGFAKNGAAARAEERRLLLEARDGDPRALRRLLERLSPPIYRFGRSFCRDSDDAEDVMFLRYNELRPLIGDQTIFDAKALIAERKIQREEAYEFRPRAWIGAIPFASECSTWSASKGVRRPPGWLRRNSLSFWPSTSSLMTTVTFRRLT